MYQNLDFGTFLVTETQAHLYNTIFEVPLSVFAERPKLFKHIMNIKSEKAQQAVYYNNLEKEKVEVYLELDMFVKDKQISSVFLTFCKPQILSSIPKLKSKSSDDLLKTSDIKDAVGFVVDKIMKIVNAPEAKFEDDYIAISKKARF